MAEITQKENGDGLLKNCEICGEVLPKRFKVARIGYYGFYGTKPSFNICDLCYLKRIKRNV